MLAAGVRGAGVVPVHVLPGPAGTSVDPVPVGPHKRRPRLQRLQEVGVRQQLSAPRPASEGSPVTLKCTAAAVHVFSAWEKHLNYPLI